MIYSIHIHSFIPLFSAHIVKNPGHGFLPSTSHCNLTFETNPNIFKEKPTLSGGSNPDLLLRAHRDDYADDATTSLLHPHWQLHYELTDLYFVLSPNILVIEIEHPFHFVNSYF